MRSSVAYQVWRGSRRTLDDKRDPLLERHTPDVALRAAAEIAIESSLYHCITRHGEEWATITPSGEIVWLQPNGPKPKKGKW